MKFISCDLETSGVESHRHQILEFAAVIEDTCNIKPVRKLPYFHTFIEWDNIFGDPVALRLNARIIEKLANPEIEKLTAHELAIKFVNWLGTQGMDITKKMTFAGKNFSGFDRQFLVKMPNWHMVKMHYRSLDVGALFWNPHTDEEIPSSELCCERAGVHSPTHEALDDARTIIDLLRKAKVMHDDASFPFSFDSWDGEMEAMQFNGCDWREDWGPYKKGQRTEHLTIRYGDGLIEEWSTDGKLVKRMRFKATFVEELPLEEETPQVVA